MANSDLVVSTETGGLGNRLKSWVSSMRLGADSRVHWPVTKNMPAPFGELFVNDCAVDAVPPGAAVYGSWRLADPTARRAVFAGRFRDGGCRRASARARPRQGVVDADGASAPIGIGSWCFRSSIRAAPRAQMRGTSTSSTSAYRSTFASVYGELFRRIAVRPEIAAAAAAWAAANLDDDVVGVQVRTWRDDARRHRKYHVPALRRLTRLLDEAGPSARFLVVSDSDDVAPMLGERYGARRVLSLSAQHVAGR